MNTRKIMIQYGLFVVITLAVLVFLAPLLLSQATPEESTFFPLGTGANDLVRELAIAPNGDIYAIGNFTEAGDVTVNHIALWNGNTWSALGTGITSDYAIDAFAVAVDHNSGDVYAGGRFQRAGGVPVNNIARWDGQEWHSMGSGIDKGGLGMTVWDIAVAPNGDVYVVGDFTGAGDVDANYVIRWDGSNWSALGSGLSSKAFAIAIDVNSNVYVGGSFIQAGSSSAQSVARWDGSNWSALGGGLGMEGGTLAHVYTVIVDDAGNLYAGGKFTHSLGLTMLNVARWNGYSWSAFGQGINGEVRDLAFDSIGNLYAGGQFIEGGTPATYDMARWDSTSWESVGDSDGMIWALQGDSKGNVYIGGSFSTMGGVAVSNIVRQVHDSAWPQQTAIAATQTAQIGATQTVQAGATQTANVPTPTLTPGPVHLPLIEKNWQPVVTLDDAPNICLQAYSIEVGTKSYRDDFEANNDADWYRFQATHGMNYQIDVTRIGENLLPVVRLYDNNCQYLELQGVPFENGTRLQWTHGWPSGWHHLLVYEAYGNTGPDTEYELSAQEKSTER